MKLPTAALLSLATLLPIGCDAPAEGSCDVVVSSFRKLSANGVSLNGASLNGTSDNGVSLNGVSLNGRLNGVSLNGLSLNGIATNGAALDDASVLIDVALDGTALVATTEDGRDIAGQDWVGATLRASVGDEIVELEISEVRRDGDLEHYTLAYEGEPLCTGLFLAGVWDESGARHDSLADGAFAHTFSCSDGALAKCIEWGYAPHTVGADAHQSCTRLVRADYCGDGTPHTADGTEIDVFDRLGVQESDTSVDFAFEAGWGPDGAVCISRPRYDELSSDGDLIVPSCMDELPACDDATTAFSVGAQIVTRSAEQTLCYEG